MRTRKSFSVILLQASWVIAFLILSNSSFAQKGAKPYYHEDLYSLRPKYPEAVDTASQTTTVRKKGPVVPQKNVNKKVDGVLDSINQFNTTKKFIDGYTIQIFSGKNQQEALNAKKKLSTDAADLSGELEYNQPNFRVRVGAYYSRLEAQKDLLRLKRSFSNAILVPEKIIAR